MNSLPNLIIFGAAKAGSSSLHWFLNTHPDVFMSSPKELSFFLPDRNWSRGIEWYAEHFSSPPAAGAMIRGETTPHYGRGWRYAGVPERIATVLPHARFICVARHPVERMISEYHHRRSNGTESRDIDEALYDRKVYHEWSRYYEQVARYIAVFGIERVLVLIAERLFANDEAEVRRLAHFLGVDPGPLVGKSFNQENPTSNRAVRPQAIRRLAGTPVYRGISRSIPAPIRRSWRRVTSTKYSEEQRSRQPSNETIKWVSDSLQDDVDQLRRMLDDPIREWSRG